MVLNSNIDISKLSELTHMKESRLSLSRESNNWQTLLGQYDGTTDDINSQQQMLFKMQTENLKSNYYVCDVPSDIATATIDSSLTEEYPNMEDHIIVVTKNLTNLYDLILPLRSKHSGRLKHIVILCPFDMPLNIWRQISVFDGIHLIKGSALEENDIRRAGVFQASQVVILAVAGRDIEKSVVNDVLIDADAIFSYQCVKRLNERARIIMEMVRYQNVGFLDAGSSIRESDYKFTSYFASGSLFSSSVLDAAVCQVN